MLGVNPAAAPPRFVLFRALPHGIVVAMAGGSPEHVCQICLAAPERLSRTKVMRAFVSPRCPTSVPHIYHRRCLIAWCAEHDTCPTCNKTIVEDSPGDVVDLNRPIFTEPEGCPPAPASYDGPLNMNGSADRTTLKYKAWALEHPDEAAEYKAAKEAWQALCDAAYAEWRAAHVEAMEH